MHINVKQLLREPSGSVRTYEVAEQVALDDVAHAVCGSVKLFRTNDSLWVTARLEASAPSLCSLCLEEFAQSLDLVIDEETQSPSAFTEAGGERLSIDDDVLDLTEAIRQYLEIAPPMKPLCKPGCKGLCPECGVNLNSATCGCNAAFRDPRWGALLTMSASGVDTEES